MSRLALPLFFLLASAAALAQDSAELRKAPVGKKFTTSKGVSFTLVFRSPAGKEAWRDDKSGILWSDSLTERASRVEAASLCARRIPGENVVEGKQLGEVPTTDDFARAEEHGFREVLPGMKDEYYWVKSSVPNAPNVGHVFSGNLGRPILIVYRSINFEHVRCIRRNAG